MFTHQRLGMATYVVGRPPVEMLPSQLMMTSLPTAKGMLAVWSAVMLLVPSLANFPVSLWLFGQLELCWFHPWPVSPVCFPVYRDAWVFT